MKVQLKSFSILGTGKFFALLYGFFSLLFVPVFVITAVTGSRAGLIEMSMLVIYPLIGFLTGSIGAAVYNLASGIVGGLEITLEIPDQSKSAGTLKRSDLAPLTMTKSVAFIKSR